MAVDRPEVAQAQLLEQARAEQEILGLDLPLAPEAVEVVAPGQPREELLRLVVQLVVGRAGAEAVEIAGDGPDVLGDRPFVVVEDDDQPLRAGDDVVEGLEGDAAGEGGVAADRDHVLGGAAQVARRRHPQGGAQGGAGMAGAEGVIGALGPVEEAAGPVRLAQLAEEFAAAAGEELVGIALVGHVEDQLVGRAVEDPVQRDAQLDHPQVGADMAAVGGRDLDDLIPQLLGELGQGGGGEGLDVGRSADAVEQVGRSWIHARSGVSLEVERGESGAFLLFLEEFNLEFGFFKSGLTEFEQLGAFLEFCKEVGERDFARFHRLDDGLQLLQGGLEGHLFFF